MPTKIPATVVTGFLGAGKTSLIQHLLRTANGRRLALIINEFGDIGVDGEILKGCRIEGCEDENLIELANGCICCTVADDFLPTMAALLNRPSPPDHIVIETSGLALPKPLIKAFTWPEVRTRVTVDGVIAVVDGPAAAAGRFAEDLDALAALRAADPSLDHDSPLAELFEDQLAAADIVILNKSDQMDATARAAAEQAVADKLRPSVRSCRRASGPSMPGSCSASGPRPDDLAQRPSRHDAEGEHDHDDFESFHVELPELGSTQRLLEAIAVAVSANDILRIKGFLAVAGKEMRLVLQGVGGRLQHYYDRAWAPGEKRASRLVVIGLKGLDRRAITAVLAAGAA
jgi:cobalamin biosynthesis protein CobW